MGIFSKYVKTKGQNLAITNAYLNYGSLKFCGMSPSESALYGVKMANSKSELNQPAKCIHN